MGRAPCSGVPGQQVEFGHKFILGEVDGGIISDCQILAGSPSAAGHLIGQVERHRERFCHPPALVTTDRGFHALGNEEAVERLGVQRVAIPAPGKPLPERVQHERQRWFRRAQAFRAGIEERISMAKRRGWLGRCRNHGQHGFDCWIGWGVMVTNLTTMARQPAASTAKPAA